jgi:sterol desaturase/sphingolipid hydroxylase (fatty acid hydroxylase superfamily)
MENLLASKGLLVGLWLVAFLAAERLRPAAPRPAPEIGLGRGRLLRNAALAAVNLVLSPLIVVPLTAAAAGQALAWRPLWWQGSPGLALDLLLLDGLIYWWHRANHEWRFLWRFHGVHHLDRFLDASTALRFHFGEVLLSAAARAGVILLVGFPLASVLTFEAAVLVAAIFHHSNLRLPQHLEAALAKVVITPSIHWVHHHRRRRDTDANYGTIFSFWDRMFGSRTPTRRRPTMPIGIEGEDELGLLDLLARPFQPARRA